MIRNMFYRILSVAILLSLLQVVIPATPVLAAPILNLSPDSGAVGTKVSVTMENFNSYIGDDIYLFFDDDGITYWSEVNVYGTNPEVDNRGEDLDDDGVPIE